MQKVARIVAIFVVGLMVVIHSTSVEARRGKVRFQLTKEQKEEKARKQEEAERREKEKKALNKFQQDARDHAMYLNCAVRTKKIENEYFASPAARTADITSTGEYLFRAYLRTVKWDAECFEWKDPAAAERTRLSLRDYVIGGVHPVLKDQLHKLFVALEAEECSFGLKCKPGITSAFRDDYRQQIATGYKARTGHSMHGGSSVTKGWGDGRAVDVVNASEPNFFDDSGVSASEMMWHHIDTLGPPIGIYRPMPESSRRPDPMHLQSMDWLQSLIASGKRTIELVIEKAKEKKDIALERVRESAKEVFKKFKKKKKCRFRKKCG